MMRSASYSGIVAASGNGRPTIILPYRYISNEKQGWINVKKRSILITIISIISIIFISSFFIRWIPTKTRIIDPLMIDVSKVTVETAAPDLLNTNQDYYFRLLNISDKSVKLIGIELSNYMGMNVGELTYKGRLSMG